MEEGVESYARLWDGSELGWTVCATRRQRRYLTVLFGAAGPSVRDVVAMRAVFGVLGERSSESVWSEVRGKTSVAIAGEYSPIDAPELVREARKRGLRVDVASVEATSYVAYNERTTEAVVIEDDALAAEVARRMMDAGVPVRWAEID